MALVVSESDTDYTAHAYANGKGDARSELWRTASTSRQPGIWIGEKWRDSQINAATPRTRSQVEYLGVHAEHLQRAYIEPMPSLRARIVDAVWWAIGCGLVAALAWASMRVPG